MMAKLNEQQYQEKLIRSFRMLFRVLMGKTYEQVGNEFEISASRVSQLCRWTLRQLNPDGDNPLDEYVDFYSVAQARRNKEYWLGMAQDKGLYQKYTPNSLRLVK